ncbi:hypothetical protein POSPLADRAFT_1059320 [Postia placenta MAD-698-R-SB12]|uniref:Uncharacterized protein n=1 Tax=Postia placenta MAD-698-R-SB12 TaxID=670580 RepID=A0A1X6MUY3_9APHY|nr:hypothetical protein POSPLADRAFT_1059320 [Postia placenta MAD-698-R-SB12]OSX60032.1 hypothetical protein POSPLADRAFT_1059320 [Postia placenta MAD-698-R-SB12]
MDVGNGDQDVMRIWSLLTEVSEQLTQNRSLSVSLHSLTGGIKTQAIHSQTGFVLRRYNLDRPKDVYEAELERMSASMIEENQTLQNDNRQLNALIREYEQTLENVMDQFRKRAYEVQQHELALMREYESAIIQRETEALDAVLTTNDARSESLARLGRLLRVIIRKIGGEDIGAYEALVEGAGPPSPKAAIASGPSASTQNEPTHEDGEAAVDVDGNLAVNHELDEEDEPENIDRRLAAAEWSLERESELARLEHENEELRALLNGTLSATRSAHVHAPMPRPPTTASAPANSDGSSFGQSMGGEEGYMSGLVELHRPRSGGADAGTVSAHSWIRPRQMPRGSGGRGQMGPFGTFRSPPQS